MNRNFNKRKYWLYIVLVIALLNACKKSDAIFNKELFAYTAPGSSAYNVISGSNFTIVRSAIFPPANTAFPVLLTRSFDKDVQITGVVDTTLLASYDSINKTTSPRFSATSFKLSNNGMVTIKAGQTSSSDSIQVLIGDTTGLDLSKTYVVPVRLTTSSAGVPLSNTRQMMYVKAGFTKVNSSVASGLLTISAGFTSTLKAGPAVGFPATLNSTISKSVVISFVDDASLVAAYNTANKTSYTAMPAGTYALTKNSVTIAAGATTSTDSVKVQFPDLSVFTSGTPYLLPIKIKDEGDVIPATTNNVKYILLTPRLATASIPASGNNTINVNLAVSPLGTVAGPSQVGFGAALNAALSGTANVVIQDDPSLVAAYNTANKTNYLAFPSSSYTLSKNSVAISAGNTNSGTDSFFVKLNNLSSFTMGNEYLLPVKIVTPDASNIAGGASGNIAYIHIIPVFNNIDPTNSGLTGTALSKTGWTATASSTYSSSYPASNTIDGNNGTSWFAAISSKPYVQINMGSQQTIKGFSIVPNYGAFGTTYNFLTMQVFTSNDGNSWTSQGTYSGTTTSTSSNATSPDLKTVRFIAPVTAQYYRLQILTGSSSYTGIGEVNAVQ